MEMNRASRVFTTDDPANKLAGAPPNFGESVVPHVYSFAGLYNTFARTYLTSDEALRQSRQNAIFMRNDCRLMECLEMRKRAVALLKWHLEIDDEKNKQAKRLKEDMTKILQSTYRFMQFRESHLDALWYGRAANQLAMEWRRIDGVTPANNYGQVCVPKRGLNQGWKPINGDKLVFRFDDPSLSERTDGAYGGQLGIRVATYFRPGDTIAGRFRVEPISATGPTDYGMAYFIDRARRGLVTVHTHIVEDAEFETPERAGRIWGAGIRDRIYWMWTISQELLQMMVDFIERSAFGFEIWYFDQNNETSQRAVAQAAKDRCAQMKNVILVPVDYTNPNVRETVKRIEPGMSGVAELRNIIQEYFGWNIKRYILGQVATSEPIGAGMGSSLPAIQMNSFYQIIAYDATNHEETMTEEVLHPWVLWNYPHLAHIPLRFKLETETPDATQMMEAISKAFTMNAKIPAKAVYDACGVKPPEEGDEVLQQAQQGQPGGAPGQPGGQPDGMLPATNDGRDVPDNPQEIWRQATAVMVDGLKNSTRYEHATV